MYLIKLIDVHNWFVILTYCGVCTMWDFLACSGFWWISFLPCNIVTNTGIEEFQKLVKWSEYEEFCMILKAPNLNLGLTQELFQPQSRIRHQDLCPDFLWLMGDPTPALTYLEGDRKWSLVLAYKTMGVMCHSCNKLSESLFLVTHKLMTAHSSWLSFASTA